MRKANNKPRLEDARYCTKEVGRYITGKKHAKITSKTHVHRIQAVRYTMYDHYDQLVKRAGLSFKSFV